jgi:signal transduction histidine kinase
MLNLMRRLIGEDLHLAWLPGPLWPVRIDPSQVDQILANLCVNARDAIAGTGQIHVATENAVLDAEYCEGGRTPFRATM